MENEPSSQPPVLPDVQSPAGTSKRRQIIGLGVLFLVLALSVLVLHSFYSPTGKKEREVNELLDKFSQQSRRFNSSSNNPLDRVREFVENMMYRFNSNQHQNYLGQYEIAERLSKMGPDIIPFLLKRLEREPSDETREAILESLTKFDGFNATPHLLKALQQDPSGKVRSEAARLCIGHDPEHTAKELITALVKDKDDSVRISVASVLDQLEASLAVPPLIKSLETDASTSVKSVAASSLGRLEDPRAIPPLRVTLKSSAKNLQQSSAVALAELGDREALPFLINEMEQVVNKLKQAATNNNANQSNWYSDNIDTQFVSALGKLAAPEGVPVLLDALPLSKDEWKQREIIEALGKTHDVRSVPALINLLTTTNKLAAAAAEALAEIGTPEVYRSLLEVVSQPGNNGRIYAAQALGKNGQNSVVPMLIDALGNSPDEEIRKNCAEALGLTGDPKAVPVLITALKDSNSSVQQEALWALGHIGEAEGAKPMLELLGHKEFSLRFSAAFALAGIQNPIAIDRLKDMLTDSEERAALAAACSLAFHGSAAGMDVLRKNTRSKEAWQRMAAIVGLYRLNTQEARDLIQTRADDKDVSIRLLVKTGMEKGAPAALAEILQSGSKDFRHYAARMLPFFRDTSTIPALLIAAKDPRAEIRNAARVAAVHLERLKPAN